MGRAETRRALHSSETNEWYTPEYVVEIARRTMGAIDLDPASCVRANRVIRAAHIYTIETDGLRQRWWGRVWLNPPYGRGARNRSNQDLWTGKLVQAYERGDVAEAVLLVNATTDRKWFKPLWRHYICFAYKRIRFEAVEGNKNSPTHGSVLVYFGWRPGAFRREVEAIDFGRVVAPECPVIVPVRRTPIPAIEGAAA